MSIGDLDLVSFRHLVNYLTSYDFSSKSKLITLNIKLINKITKFDTDIKIILRDLFGLKIKSLLNLQLFTNIFIENKANYSYLIKILKYNWIPSYTIIFNEHSNYISDLLDISEKKISFLASPSIEDIVFKDTIIKISSNKNNQEDEDDIFWILKYLFNCEYSY